ncbi:low temperature requirement A [Deinococcus aerius]|uniref:Low temperature requirement A n=1 Tax=Deinococcus aerius TaxID=200253 RepID=A0A2I9E2Q6_9DEIO|nr:low temperature requirement protein A [Deinococcus aerius]GBF08105.1 low temperature requirement A [Deinococcus aerius]
MRRSSFLGGGFVRVAGSAERGGRHASWLELFFDLVFVVAVGNLGRLLLEDPRPGGVLTFLGLFVPVWWAWIGISYWVDQFELPEVAGRLLMFGQLALSLGLAVGLPRVVEGEPALFAGSYLGMRLTLTLLYLWAWRALPEGRELNAKYTLSFALGTALWALSLLLPLPERYVVWGVALALEIAATIWAYVSTRELPRQVSHMDERFGLFTIIVLGESVLAVATGGEHVQGWPSAVVAACGLALAFAVWWLYFDYADDSVINRAIRGGTRALYLSFVYGYTHLLVFASIVAASIGLERAFEDVTHGHLGGPTRLLLGGGLALFLAAVSVVQWAGPCRLPARILGARALTGGLVGLLALLGDGLPALAALLLLTALVLALVVYEHLSLRGERAGQASPAGGDATPPASADTGRRAP